LPRNVDGRAEPRLRPHATYLQLGTTDEARRAAYRQLIEAGLTPGDDNALALHTRQQKPWGSNRFKRKIEALVQRSLEVRPRGRPRSGG
jgi:putative transposase